MRALPCPAKTHLVDPELELFILCQAVVCRQHHEGLLVVVHGGCASDPLPWRAFTVELLLLPFEAQQQLVVLIAEPSRGAHPSTLEPTSIAVASAEVVGAREGDNLLVIEAHAVEDVAKVVLSLRAIGQAATGGQHAVVGKVGAACLPGNVGPAHGLDCDDATERPDWRGGERSVEGASRQRSRHARSE